MATNGNEMATEKVPKSSSKFSCEICDYYTCRLSQYHRHLLTLKHENQQNGNKKVPKVPKSSQTLNCENCEKSFADRTGLWKHKKKCNVILKNDFVVDKDFVMMVIKQNAELQNQMLEVIKIGTNGIHNNNNNNNNTNSLNKTFNLQFFLNETCKDAMNIMDFVDSVQLQLDDLEKVGECGFVNGISNIIIKNLKNLDITQRPVHCTDVKREVLYVKDEDKWVKEEQEKQKLRKAVKHIAHKNSKLIALFREKYPDCNKSDSKYSNKYNKLIIEAFSGDYDSENSIIKKISKATLVDKN